MGKNPINEELFQFLEDLTVNNNREWFKANKKRYEAQVKNPLLQFVTDYEPRLESLSPYFVADPSPVGGSMFRIYRDIRFSKDKTPYKTHAALQFRHELGKDVHAPCFYLHIELNDVFAGGGIWHPDSKSLGKIRTAIDEKQDEWNGIFADEDFRNTFSVGGDSLKRPPRGYSKDHPLIDDLKRKDHVVSLEFTRKEVCSAAFMDKLTEAFAVTVPYISFLAAALELDF